MRPQAPTLLPTHSNTADLRQEPRAFLGTSRGLLNSTPFPPSHQEAVQRAKSSVHGTQMASPCHPNLPARMIGFWAILEIARVSWQSTQSIPGALTWPGYANIVTKSLLPGRKGMYGNIL